MQKVPSKNICTGAIIISFLHNTVHSTSRETSNVSRPLSLKRNKSVTKMWEPNYTAQTPCSPLVFKLQSAEKESTCIGHNYGYGLVLPHCFLNCVQVICTQNSSSALPPSPHSLTQATKWSYNLSI